MMKNEFYKYLCCGYDKIRNSYANQKRMTFTPILDETLLEQRMAAWYTAPEGTSRSESHTAISTSRYEMEESFDTSCGVSYNVLNVSASLSTSVGLTESVSENSAYGKIFSSHQLRQYNHILTTNELSECLTESFQRDLKQCEAEEIFRRYGTHLIRSFRTGGRIVMEFSMKDRGGKSISEVKAMAEAKYKSIAANVSAEQKKMAEYFAGHSEIDLWTIGGTPTALSDWEDRKDVMKTWMESLEEAPAMYQVQAEIPLWELVRDPEQKKRLEAGFRAHERAALLEAMHRIPFITDLRVIMSGGSDIRNLLKEGDIVTKKNPTTSSSNCDLNEKAGGKYIYLVYRLGRDASKKIGDIRVISRGKADRTPSPSDYSVIDQDLNKGAGGDYIYLEYKKDTIPDMPGICVLGVRESTVPFSEDWKPVVDQGGKTADLNKKAGGKYLYLYYLVHPYVKKLGRAVKALS